MRTLPVAHSSRLLHKVRIASPCEASWQDMAGNDLKRFCRACSKSVYNLESLTADEAEQLILENEGSLCVRLYRRRDGTVLTADCPLGLAERALGRARIVAIAMVASMMAALTVVGASLALFPPRVGEDSPPRVEGAIAYRAPLSGLSFGEVRKSARDRLGRRWPGLGEHAAGGI